MLVDVNKVATALNITVQRVGQLVDEGLPKEGRGEYDLGRCMLWYIRYLQDRLRRRASGGEDGTDSSISEERKRLLKAQADREEFELKKVRCEVVPIAIFEEQLGKMIAAARQRLLMLPARIAPELENEGRHQIKTKLTAAIHSTLAVLAHGGKNGRRRRTSAASVPPARAANGTDGPGLPEGEPAVVPAAEPSRQ